MNRPKSSPLPEPIVKEMHFLFMALLQSWIGSTFRSLDTPNLFTQKESSFQFYCSLAVAEIIDRFGKDISGHEKVDNYEIIPQLLHLVDVREGIRSVIQQAHGKLAIESKETGIVEMVDDNDVFAVVARREGVYWIDPRATDSFSIRALRMERKRLDAQQKTESE